MLAAPSNPKDRPVYHAYASVKFIIDSVVFDEDIFNVNSFRIVLSHFMISSSENLLLSVPTT